MVAYLAFGILFFFKYKRPVYILHKEIAARGHFQYGKCVSHIWSFILKAGAPLPMSCQWARVTEQNSGSASTILCSSSQLSFPHLEREKSGRKDELRFLSSMRIKSASPKSWEWFWGGFSGRFFPLCSPHGEAAMEEELENSPALSKAKNSGISHFKLKFKHSVHMWRNITTTPAGRKSKYNKYWCTMWCFPPFPPVYLSAALVSIPPNSSSLHFLSLLSW